MKQFRSTASVVEADNFGHARFFFVRQKEKEIFSTS